MASNTTATSLTSYPTTPSYPDDLEWITAYLTIHVLSDASRVYSYILWIAIAVVLLVYTAFHWAHLRGGYLGAYWSKWSLRRRTWRKKHSLAVAKRNGQPHRQPLSLPSNAQLLTLVVLTIAALLLAFAGPDYFAPGSTLWTVHNAALAKRAAYNATTFAPYQPHYTVSKAWWTSGNRTGLVAFALFPLCILFVLKASPFAIFSLPFTIQLHFDKLLWLHKWCARLIYFFTVLHVVFWSVELSIDHRVGTGKMAYTYAWQYEKFRFAWAAFAVMTLIFICSISPFRRDHYEAFWFLHVLFVPLTLIMAAMHHPPLWWWCWTALGLWVGERAWRLTWWLHANGFTGGMLPSGRHNQAQLASTQIPGKIDAGQTNYFSDPKLVGKGSPAMSSSQSLGLTHYPPPPNSALILGFRTPYAPPPGFAHAELLPGRTVRLRLITPGYLPWAPGQHFLISIPSISRCTTHPFTAASICDEQAPGDDGRAIVFLIRAKNGWTRDLWDTVAQMISRGQNTVPSENLPVNYPRPGRGVLLRTCVDGPFGSSARADWGAYSTVVIVAGGSGVSFALSVLEYMCLCLAGRDGKYLGGRPGGFGRAGFKTTRVRFVWLVREFGHIQWCASTLRRCMSMIPSPELHVDIFVTNVKLPIDTLPSASSIPTPSQSTVDGLVPPTPEFALEGQPLHTGNRRHTRTPSADSVDSDGDSDVDLSYYTSDFVQPEGELGHEESILDLTNYEGDNDTGMPGEEQFNLSIRREGRTRRANTRRASMAMFAKREPDHRLSEPLSQAPDLSSLHLVGGHTSLPPLRINHTHAPATGSKLALQMDVDDMTPVDLSPMQTPNSAIPLLDNNLHHSSGLQSPIARPSPRMRAGMAELSPQLETSPSTTASTMTRPQSMMSGWSETNSLAALMQRGELDIHEQLKLDLDEQELQDVGIIAEVARPGKPKLERTLAAEIERAKGAIIVGCCGPTSLDALMRKTIAAQIDPARVARGDMRGSIALVSEDFAY